MTNNPKFYKKVINNGLFQNRELLSDDKKKIIMEKIYLERNKDVAKKKRLKDAIGIAVCFCLIFFTIHAVLNQVDNKNVQNTISGQRATNPEAALVIKPLPAKVGELTGEEWFKLDDHEKYNFIGAVLEEGGIKLSERQKYLTLLKNQLDRGLKLKEHQNTGVNSAIMYLFNKYQIKEEN